MYNLKNDTSSDKLMIQGNFICIKHHRSENDVISVLSRPLNNRKNVWAYCSIHIVCCCIIYIIVEMVHVFQ